MFRSAIENMFRLHTSTSRNLLLIGPQLDSYAKCIQRNKQRRFRHARNVRLEL